MKPDLKETFSKIYSKPAAYLFLAFLIPLIVRAVPEILMGSYLLGFDNIGYYVPNTFLWPQNGVGFWNFMAAVPFLYTLLIGLTSVGVPIVISLKVMSPLLLKMHQKNEGKNHESN